MAETAADVLIETMYDWGLDPFEPPMPARITLEQAAKFARSLLRGEPNRDKITLTVLADKVRELI